MRTTPTFEHGRQQWCVQLVELGPSPVLFWCISEARAKQLSEEINAGRRIAIGTNELASQAQSPVSDLVKFLKESGPL